MKSSAGRVDAKPTSPRSNGWLVSRYARNGRAVVCIHEPINEINWPIQKSRKFRDARAGKRCAINEASTNRISSVVLEVFGFIKGFFTKYFIGVILVGSSEKKDFIAVGEEREELT
jgi:hypothetical protein